MDNPTNPETNNQPPADNGTPPAEGGSTPPANTGLPSDANSGVSLNFELTDTIKERFITADGKLLGKYENLEQLADAHKNLQDKHAQYVDEVKQREAKITNGVEADVIQAEKLEAIKGVIPEFLKNNMELTPEIETVLTEKGLDIRDIKLGAIELRDKINQAHAEVGGKENYEAMMGWASQTLTDAEKASFDADVMGANSRFTIKGLYSEYQAAQANGTTTPNPQRLMGDSTEVGIKAYSSREEIFKDKQYLDSPQGRNDTAARAKYNARLAKTDSKLWRGY